MIKYHQISKFLTYSAFILPIALACPAFAESTVQYIDDASITAKVKEGVFHDPQLKVMRIKVKTIDGYVSLSGRIDNNDQDLEAVKIASQVKGVINVTDNMAVTAQE